MQKAISKENDMVYTLKKLKENNSVPDKILQLIAEHFATNKVRGMSVKSNSQSNLLINN